MISRFWDHFLQTCHRVFWGTVFGSQQQTWLIQSEFSISIFSCNVLYSMISAYFLILLHRRHLQPSAAWVTCTRPSATIPTPWPATSSASCWPNSPRISSPRLGSWATWEPSTSPWVTSITPCSATNSTWASPRASATSARRRAPTATWEARTTTAATSTRPCPTTHTCWS